MFKWICRLQIADAGYKMQQKMQHFISLLLSPTKKVVENISTVSGVTILLSLTVFLNMVVETMPVTSDNPLLGKRATPRREPVPKYLTHVSD